MKKMFTKRFATLAALLSAAFLMSAPLGAAETKIGLVDLKKVFDGYYKTKQADSQLKERVGDSDKVLKGMIDDYQKANDDYKKLIDGSNDQAVSNDEREKRKKNAENKLMELQEIERSIKQFRSQTTTTLEEQKRRMRDEILRHLRDVIATHAKKGGYTHVFDTAAESISATSVLLYTNGQNDFTDDVLNEVNASAPAGGLATETKVDTKAPTDTKAPLSDALDPKKLKK